MHTLQHSTRRTARTVPCVQPVTIQNLGAVLVVCRALLWLLFRCSGPNPAGDVRCIAESSVKPRRRLTGRLDVAVQTLILPAMFEGEMHHLWPTLLLDTNAVSQWVDVREPLQWLSYNLLWHSMRSAACTVTACTMQRAT